MGKTTFNSNVNVINVNERIFSDEMITKNKMYSLFARIHSKRKSADTDIGEFILTPKVDINTALDGAYTAGDDTFDVTDGSKIKKGYQLTVGVSTYAVTAVSGNTITVTVKDSDANHADGEIVKPMISSKEYQLWQDKQIKQNKKIMTYSQDFVSDFSFTKKQRVSKDYISGGLLAQTADLEMQGLITSLAYSAVNSYKDAGNEADGTRNMLGLDELIKTEGYTLNGSLTEENINNVINYLVENGFTPKQLYVSISDAKTIRGLAGSVVRTEFGQTQIGTYVSTFYAECGAVLEIFSDATVLPKKQYFIDDSQIELKELIPFELMNQGFDGTVEKYHIEGSYRIEVPNGNRYGRLVNP